MMMLKLVLAHGQTLECADRGAQSMLVELPHGVMLCYRDAAGRSTGQWDVYPWHTITSWGRYRQYPRRSRTVAVGPARRSSR